MSVARRQGTRHAHLKPGPANWIAAATGVRGLGFNYVVAQDFSTAEIYIDRGDASQNKLIFDQLYSHRSEIDQAFGEPLSWERLDLKQASRIKHVIDLGGYRSPESEWPKIHETMIGAMNKLEKAFQPYLQLLNVK